MNDTDPDIITSTVIYNKGGIQVRAFLLADEGPHPLDEAACTAEDERAFVDGLWRYVEVSVLVAFRGDQIGVDTLRKVPHGVMGDGREADALAWRPAVICGQIHQPPSQLWDTASEAVDCAQRWFRALGGVPPVADSPLAKLITWVEPERRAG